MKDNLVLPARDPAVRDSAPLQSQTNPPHHILVVEDDVAIRRLNTAVLLRSGYAVDIAEDGAAAWEALNADNYDLIITDNSMPKVTGVELLKKLRAARLELPVIMATGTLPIQEFARYPWLQPAATLVKPYTIEALLDTVKKVLREADVTAAAPRPRPANSSHRILAVDEDRDLRRLYAEALAHPGYSVDVAEDGAAGWEALQVNRYHLLITEHDLPKLTGVELVRKLRAARMALPVVMAAGRLPTQELARNPSLQLAAMLVKPFAVDALLDTVENVLRATDRPREQIAEPTIWQSQPSAAGWQL
jgi:DNA-binding response OmpR family regulator